MSERYNVMSSAPTTIDIRLELDEAEVRALIDIVKAANNPLLAAHLYHFERTLETFEWYRQREKI